MAKVLFFALLLFGLTAVFKRVAEWFEDVKNINIVPAALVEVVAVIIFIFTHGSKSTGGIVWMWVSVAVVLVVTIVNLIKYGIKDGVLVSFSELAFSVSAALLLICVFVSQNEKNKYKRSHHRRK